MAFIPLKLSLVAHYWTHFFNLLLESHNNCGKIGSNTWDSHGFFLSLLSLGRMEPNSNWLSNSLKCIWWFWMTRNCLYSTLNRDTICSKALMTGIFHMPWLPHKPLNVSGIRLSEIHHWLTLFCQILHNSHTIYLKVGLFRKKIIKIE